MRIILEESQHLLLQTNRGNIIIDVLANGNVRLEHPADVSRPLVTHEFIHANRSGVMLYATEYDCTKAYKEFGLTKQ